MRTIYFISDNREINESNVANLFGRINKFGFLPEIGTIDYLQSEVLKECTIYEVKIVKIKPARDWSLSNWKLEYKEVDYSDGIRAIFDGQHKLVASMLIQLIHNKDMLTDKCYRKIELPKGLSISQAIEMKNSGRMWTREDIDAKKLPTGNKYLDDMVRIADETKIKSQVFIDYCTSSTITITSAKMKEYRSGVKECNVEFTQEYIDTGMKVLDAFKRNQSTTVDFYNTTRMSEAVRAFIKQNDVDMIVKVIDAMSKDVIESTFKPAKGVSAEKEFYLKAFNTVRDLIR